MISYIQGKIIKKLSNSVIIKNNGLGYEVFLNNNYSDIHENREIELYTYLHIREDNWTLYGFLSWEEREIFLLLIGISGIGPKIGLSIISNSSLGQLKNSIAMGNIDNLTKIPGIGKKTAQRIIIELKDKIVQYLLPKQENEILMDDDYITLEGNNIFEALKSLGYQTAEIKKVLPIVLEENNETSEAILIKKALQKLARI